ncbi:hypothetical protein [Chlorobium sp.]|uniref:hypothetical protein n=1 Tax=Chlorobium sp. TaxID=1095 RepID=UPI003C515C6E
MSNSISPASLQRILGIDKETPLGLDAMCAKLRCVLYPARTIPKRLERFCEALTGIMRSLGISAESCSESTLPGGKFRPGTVILAPGMFADSELAINRVSTLYNNIIVGIYDEPPPLTAAATPQERLDAIVRRLARDMVHILIYVTRHSWTICTMNGGVVTFNTPLPTRDAVRGTLVPKLTAQVVPPRPEYLDFRHAALQVGNPEFRRAAVDFLGCSRAWASSSYLLTHTSTDSLEYRNDFYRKIVARYLDHRSGMSYGFFARQLPVRVLPAMPLDESTPKDEESMVPVRIGNRTLLVDVPDVRVLTTRSGCRKNHLDIETDLVEIGLENGAAYLKTPAGLAEGPVTKPSFDTLTILAHALGNAFIASILKTVNPGSTFTGMLERGGASMTHWHGYPDGGAMPEGYFVHGTDNPPVSCSTPQSAAYSLFGKIEALEQALLTGAEYLGDVHVEPNHGTNIVGVLSLEETALLLNRSPGS